MLQLTELLAAVRSFTYDFYEVFLHTQTEHLSNTFISPVCVYQALLPFLIGSKGKTKHELMEALHLPMKYCNNEEWRQVCELLASIMSVHDRVWLGPFVQCETIIQIVNKCYIKHTLPTSREFSKLCDKRCNCEITNFESDRQPELVRKSLNEAVSRDTAGAIENILPPAAISQDTDCLLLTALNVKGKWIRGFSKKETTNLPFFQLDGSHSLVPMMCKHRAKSIADFSDMECRALRLFFDDLGWSILFVLPWAHDGLPKLLTHAKKPGFISKVVNGNFQKRSLSIQIPRFHIRMEASLDTVEQLRKLGVEDLFSSQAADLYGVTESSHFHIPHFYYKANIQVREDGVTVFKSTPESSQISPLPPGDFIVDHPFFFALLTKDAFPAALGHVIHPEDF